MKSSPSWNDRDIERNWEMEDLERKQRTIAPFVLAFVFEWAEEMEIDGDVLKDTEGKGQREKGQEELRQWQGR